MSKHVNTKRKLYEGLGLLAAFVAVLVVMFTPVFGGVTGLDYMDNTYNSISKASAYYIPKVFEEAKTMAGVKVKVALPFDKETAAANAELLFQAAGAKTVLKGAELEVEGDLGRILALSLADADLMFNNQGTKVSEQYQGKDARLMLYTWYVSQKAMIKDLNKQHKFPEAMMVHTVQAKAVETAYNYYGIKPEPISQRWGVVFLSLAFYVIYTMWYGFGVMFLFEGTGFKLEH